jgi:hypothetical protein
MQGPGVRAQPDIRLHGAGELREAIRDADDIAPDEPVLLLSFEHNLYQLNTPATLRDIAVRWP